MASIIRHVLIANRGEIATRIAKAAATCDIESGQSMLVMMSALFTLGRPTVYFELDETADPIEAYLNIISFSLLRRSMVWMPFAPGYGFLSENAKSRSSLR